MTKEQLNKIIKANTSNGQIDYKAIGKEIIWTLGSESV